LNPFTVRDRSAFLRTQDDINANLERHFWRWTAILVVLLVACAIIKDIHSWLWIDELYTITTARQPGPRAIIEATTEGTDGIPPLYSIMVNALLQVVQPEALAVRLPATIGFAIMIVCVLAFCRRRLPAIYAFCAVLLACNASLYYASEGRPYGIVLGCVAGALVAWQAAVDGRRRTLSLTILATCVGLMTAMHYFSVFFIGSLLVAEIVRWGRSRVLDFRLLAAVTLPVLLVLAAHGRIIEGSRRFQAHFHSPVSWDQIPEFYIEFFLPMAALGFLALAAVSVFTPSPPTSPTRGGGFIAAEWAAMITLLLIPAIVIVMSKYTINMFLPRYLAWGVIGFAILIAGLLHIASRGQVMAAVALAAVLITIIAAREIRYLHSKPVLREAEKLRVKLETLPEDAIPIVVPNNRAFIELSYYAAPRISRRLIYPLNRDLQMRYRHVDSASLLMSSLKNRTKLPIMSYDEMLTKFPRFLLATLPEDYLPWHLVRSGYRVVPMGSVDPPVLYIVEPPSERTETGNSDVR
jgi:hypothetical protein